jgi:hypothetical protein
MTKFDLDKNGMKETSLSKPRLHCLLGLLFMCAFSGADDSRGVSGENSQAQQTAAATQSDPKAILEASAMACLQIKTIVYEVTEEQRDEHGHVMYTTVATIRQACDGSHRHAEIVEKHFLEEDERRGDRHEQEFEGAFQVTFHRPAI